MTSLRPQAGRQPGEASQGSVSGGDTVSNAGDGFERLFNPRGIAIIGASSNLDRIGGQPIRALLAAGYCGDIAPVNPRYETIAGLRCYPAAEAIDVRCDLAIVAVPAEAVQAAIEGCGKAGIGFVIVLSGGFRETGAEGAAQENLLARTARRAGVRLIGPNCQGMVNFPDRVFAAFGSITGELEVKTGGVSMAFQSGGFGFAIVSLCATEGLGFRTCVSTGNEADVTLPELLEAMLDDPGTTICGAYLEGVPDGRRLMAVGRRALDAGKPILVWKGGSSASGARAVASHTAKLAGRHEIYRAAFRQSGIIEVEDIHEMGDLFKVLEGGRLPDGNRIGVLSISGGSGIVFADRATAAGLDLADFAPHTAERLAAVIPAFGSAANPVDITSGVFNDISLFTRALEIVLDDPNIDQLALLLASIPGEIARAAATAIAGVAGATRKPVLVAWSVQRARAEQAYAILEDAGVPIVPTPVRLASAAAAAAVYAARRRSLAGRPPWPGVGDAKGVASGPTGAFDERRAKQWVASAGIPVTRDAFVARDADPDSAVEGLAYPLVVKVVSPDIAHKTEVGGVRIGIRDHRALLDAIDDVYRAVSVGAPSARIDGVLVSEMAGDGVESIAGVVNDPTFGPVVAFGVGGIFAEVFRDVTYRVAPFDAATAREMIAELRGRALFEGARGQTESDTDALVEALCVLSRFAWAEREWLGELDINPLLVRPRGQGVLALDALVVPLGA